tara:strand:- start:420 stop:677 length:258 start_codon:yes stop_codon:yes gene_type:complete
MRDFFLEAIRSPRMEMQDITFQNANKVKETFFENAFCKFCRFQDPVDKKWWAFVERKPNADGPFSIFSGPWKLKRQATEQIETWC